MTGLNCFEVKIGFMAFLLAASIGSILNLAYGQVVEEEDNKTGTLMKHKGEFYCYDETTTTKKEVKEAIKNDWMTGVVEFHNGFLSGLMEDDEDGPSEPEMAEKLCQGLVENGDITNEDYNDYIEATITWEFDWDD